MERLTKTNSDGTFVLIATLEGESDQQKFIDKLGQYEEQENMDEDNPNKLAQTGRILRLIRRVIKDWTDEQKGGFFKLFIDEFEIDMRAGVVALHKGINREDLP